MAKSESSTTVKPKLPRKRKKLAIKVQGRKWYHDTIELYRVIQKSGKFYEPVCKFWVNSSVTGKPVTRGGEVVLIPTATRFW